MATMNISLPDSMKALVDQRVRSGMYANASDYIRDLIREDQANEIWVIDEDVAAAIDAGEASGDSARPIREALAEARKSYRAG